MAGQIRIGLLGAGVVGQGILELLRDRAADIERRLGAGIEVRRIVARDQEKMRADIVPDELLAFDPQSILEDDDVDILVEVIGGLEPAGDLVVEALRRGKSVVTANKALLAERGYELIELAEKMGVDLYFEAAVAGGIPVLRVLREALASDAVTELRGIVNGTSNYILTRMRDDGMGFPEALAEAQAEGYAEADPTLDVSGGDAAHKLTILATLAFGVRVDLAQVSVQGIEALDAIDIELAGEFGYVIKPLAVGRTVGDSLDLRVHPALVPKDSVFANVSGALNAVQLEGAMLGPCLLSGYGAGALPTAMSVVSDIVDVGRNLTRGASGRVPQLAFRGERLETRPIVPRADVPGRFYLRFTMNDRAGLLARVASILGAFDVGIQQLIQPGSPGGSKRIHLVVLTQESLEGHLMDALEEIEGLGDVLEPTRAFRIEEG